MVKDNRIKWVGVPRVYVDQVNPSEVIDLDNKRSATARIENANGSAFRPSMLYAGPCTIKGRGNSSWTQYPKKPYALVFTNTAGKDVDFPAFGLPADADWVLLAGYQDKSKVRTILGSALSYALGLPWATRGLVVEFYLNGVYMGIYTFCEKVKAGKHRLDIDTNKTTTTGWTIEQQLEAQIKPGEYKFRSGAPEAKWYSFKEPDAKKITAEQGTAVKAAYDDFQARLYGANWLHPQLGYRPVIDLASYLRFGLHQDLVKNSDMYLNSWYTTRAKNSTRLQGGPIWDQDGYFGLFPAGYWISSRFQGRGDLSNPNDPYFIAQACATYERMMADPDFMVQMAAEWRRLEPRVHQTLGDFRRYSQQLLASGVVELDRALWPQILTDPLYKPLPNYAAELAWINEFITKRIYYFTRTLYDPVTMPVVPAPY